MPQHKGEILKEVYTISVTELHGYNPLGQPGSEFLGKVDEHVEWKTLC
jgi:hypothetical protein